MINPLQHIQEGWRNIRFSKLRSSLALLGVLVGTASVVAMVSAGELAMNETLKQFKSLGTDLLAVSINTPANEQDHLGKLADLNLEQALAISQSDPMILEVAPYTQAYTTAFYADIPLNVSVLGVTKIFAELMRIQLSAGRFITLADQYQFYCVIGNDIAKKIVEKRGKTPLGELIQIGKNLFVVVGIAQAWEENNFIYTNIDTSILIPIKTSLLLSKYVAIDNILFRLQAEADIALVENHISDFIQSRLANKQLNFRSAKEMLAKLKKQSEILTIFLGLIGSISLLVGGIGVMNMMLVSVIERRREIGIRLAIGAQPRDISLLFLTEAVMLSLLGGTLGVMIGISIAYFIAVFFVWEFSLLVWPILIGFFVSVIVGIFFGFYPAYRASHLDPITALRFE